MKEKIIVTLILGNITGIIPALLIGGVFKILGI